MKHSLTLERRFVGHLQRLALFGPSCSCGTWIGVPTKHRHDAEDQYRRHVQAAERAARTVRRRGRRRAAPVLRPLTPLDQLPEALRPKENPHP